MLRNIPSFAELTSLTEFYLRGDCYRIQKIEGLENYTRLQVLIVDSCWEVPGIETLECMQNLKYLALPANKRSVIERCIHRIQKWPDEIRICARAVPDAASVVDSLLPPNLIIDAYFPIIDAKLPKVSWPMKINSNGNVSIFCFVLNCVSAEIILETGYSHRGCYYSVNVGKGRGALVVVLTECTSNGYISFEADFGKGEGIVEKGLVVSGKKQTPVEAVRSLLPLLQS